MFSILRRISPSQKTSRLDSYYIKPWNLHATTNSVRNLSNDTLANHDIYISTSSDPYFNLTLEDWLFRHFSTSSPLLLIYRDSPCVVIGRNQNPWTEVNFSVLHAISIPFLRRRSGGGTVYHDLGNTNFSIHLPRTSFDRFATGRVVLHAVQSLGINASLNDRNDICVGTDKISQLNHSKSWSSRTMHWGYPWSAYKIVTKRSYHHGTMLLSTELKTLGAVLRPQKENIVTKGVDSVRSPVCNLKRHNPSITHEDFTSAVVEQFRAEYGITSEPCIVSDTDDIKNIEYIKNGMSELATWDWMYGQTPHFTHTLQHSFPWGDVTVFIQSKHGLILDCALTVTNSHITKETISSLGIFVGQFYRGKKYGFLEGIGEKEEVGMGNVNQRTVLELVREFHAWLSEKTNIPQ